MKYVLGLGSPFRNHSSELFLQFCPAQTAALNPQKSDPQFGPSPESALIHLIQKLLSPHELQENHIIIRIIYCLHLQRLICSKNLNFETQKQQLSITFQTKVMSESCVWIQDVQVAGGVVSGGACPRCGTRGTVFQQQLNHVKVKKHHL